MLIERHILSAAELQKALQQQKQTGQRLGEILQQHGLISEEQLLRFLEEQLGVARVSLAEIEPAAEALALLPSQVARRYQVIPLEKKGDRLVVATADPLNLAAMDEIFISTGLMASPVLALQGEIRRAIEKYYSTVAVIPSAQEAGTAAGDAEQTAADGGPVARLVDSILERAIAAGASDIHITPQEKNLEVRFRIDGILQDDLTLPRANHGPVITRLKVMARLDIAEHRLPQDGRIQLKLDGIPVDVRVATMPTIWGEKVVCRLLDARQGVLDLDKLGFSPCNLERFKRLISRPHGLLLVTGPTGSGKTTTLYAALNHINDRRRNIVTLEEPVEYLLPGISQTAINPRTGLTFSSGLRALLRQDPNVIMVGEIRDQETATMAVRAAVTGHLVFSTLHTSDAPGALTRLMDMGVDPYLVAAAVTGVVSQRLVRVICPECRESYILGDEHPEGRALSLPVGTPLWQGRGCPSCRHTGYRGRQAVHEVLVLTPAIRRLVETQAGPDEILQAARAGGMCSLEKDARRLVLNGVTSVAEALQLISDDF
nr:GspE/PulE family protein [Moorella sulfitireducens]